MRGMYVVSALHTSNSHGVTKISSVILITSNRETALTTARDAGRYGYDFEEGDVVTVVYATPNQPITKDDHYGRSPLVGTLNDPIIMHRTKTESGWDEKNYPQDLPNYIKHRF